MITGSAGQIGSELVRSAPKGVEVRAVTHPGLDIGDARAVDVYVANYAPDLIINAAGYTAIDQAESHRDLAHRVNAQGPALLARAAARVTDCRLIQLSTHHVFDGEAVVPYLPGDVTGPASVYAESKLAGEQGALAVLGKRALVLRTGWVYGPRGKNFLLNMLRLMRNGDVRVSADQTGTPTASASLAEVIWAFAAQPGSSGIFHWSDAGSATWYDFAVAISEEARAHDLLPEVRAVTPGASTPLSHGEAPAPARRPRYSVLDSRATVAALGIAQLHWRVRLQEVLDEIAHG